MMPGLRADTKFSCARNKDKRSGHNFGGIRMGRIKSLQNKDEFLSLGVYYVFFKSITAASKFNFL